MCNLSSQTICQYACTTNFNQNHAMMFGIAKTRVSFVWNTKDDWKYGLSRFYKNTLRARQKQKAQIYTHYWNHKSSLMHESTWRAHKTIT